MADNATTVEEPAFNPESWEKWLCAACIPCGFCPGLVVDAAVLSGVWGFVDD